VTTTHSVPTELAGLTFDIERFLRTEAWLLDDSRFEEWTQLLAPEISYRAPIRRNVTDSKLAGNPAAFSGDHELSHFNEDADSIRVRLLRLRSGAAWSEDPPSRTRRMIGNVVVAHTDSGPDNENEYDVRSAFLVHRVRMDRDVELYAGERRDRLRRTSTDFGFQIVTRLILFDHALLPASDIGIFF
jgi:3-phenylpropionate/cinnamic acid dioxygenase small subunit